MKRLLALIPLILFTGCEPDKPIVWKYTRGDKVMMKVGVEGVIKRRYSFNNYYDIRVLLAGENGEQKLDSMFAHESEIEKKIR